MFLHLIGANTKITSVAPCLKSKASVDGAPKQNQAKGELDFQHSPLSSGCYGLDLSGPPVNLCELGLVK